MFLISTLREGEQPASLLGEFTQKKMFSQPIELESVGDSQSGLESLEKKKKVCSARNGTKLIAHI